MKIDPLSPQPVRCHPAAWPALAALLAMLLLLAACNSPEGASSLLPAGDAAPAPVEQPSHCLGDGVVQTWLLRPVEPAQSELLAAYQALQVVEFQASVTGHDDDPANLPARSFLLHEAAEGITMTLQYTGDPPPLMLGRDYRLVAWAQDKPQGQAYELQVFDEAGLLFLGATDVDLQDDLLAIALEAVEGDCPFLADPDDLCVEGRQVQPLRVRWEREEVVLYPGQDGRLVHDGALYQISLFRNRQVRPGQQPCPDYAEFRRSVRIERLQPPPLPPLLPAVTTTPAPPASDSGP